MSAMINAVYELDELPLYDNAQSWYGPQMAGLDDWVHTFSAGELADIDSALAIAEASGRDIIDITRAHFPLSATTRALLDRARADVLHGRGFMVMRGMPVGRYTLQQSALAYWGLGLYLGEAVSQNGKGHVLGHVTNLGLNYSDPEVRGYQTTARLKYHADSSDIVSLLCLRTGRSGGLSSIVSSTTLWNELVRRRPDHARVLMNPLYYTRWGEIPAGRKPWSEIAAFSPWADRMIATYVRSAIEKSQRMPEVPRLSALQLAAMDHLDALAADPALHLDMAFEPGDIQVVCNHSILHSRTAYEDWPEPLRRRHLLRLWLACADGPALPPFMTQDMQGRTDSGRPDGIRVPGVPLIAPLQAA